MESCLTVKSTSVIKLKVCVLKLRKFNGIMYRARTCFSKYHLLRFYSAFIIPIMSYGLIAYGCGAKSKMDKLYLVQKKILRTILFKRKYEHITNVFIEYNIHTVFDLFFIQIFHETFRQLRNESPLKFLIRDKTSTMKTRSKSKGLLILPALRTTKVKNFVALIVINAYNFLIDNKQIPNNLNVMIEVGFKSFFKKFSRLYIIDNESMFSLFYYQ